MRTMAALETDEGYSSEDADSKAPLSGEDGDVPNEGYWEDMFADPWDFEDDVYSVIVVNLVEDFERCSRGNSAIGVQVARFASDIFLAASCMTVQVFLMVQIKHFITAKAVAQIRIKYGEFELAMCGNDTSHCDISDYTHGHCRCRTEFFDPDMFRTLDDELKDGACHIPLSEPLFFGIILWLWTMTCVGQLNLMARQFISVVWRTQRASSSAVTYEAIEGEPEADEGTKVIYQLTLPVKVVLTVCVFVPRFLMVVYLLWLGCRWLLATNNFEDLIMNAIALEFILLVGAVMHAAVSPMRSRISLAKTKMLPLAHRIGVGYSQLVWIVLVNLATFVWVYLYMHYFQSVLPDYRWDIYNVCEHWMLTHYNRSEANAEDGRSGGRVRR